MEASMDTGGKRKMEQGGDVQSQVQKKTKNPFQNFIVAKGWNLPQQTTTADSLPQTNRPSFNFSTPQPTMKPTASKVKVQIDQLGNAERLKQLSMIDKLREHGVGKDISLPQV
jgi:hypothetical protein